MSTVKTICYFNKVLYKYLVGRDGQTMDAKTFMKNVWMEAKGEKVMIEEYKALPNDALNRDYLENRLKVRLEVIYLNCIKYYKLTNFGLKKFDSWLKSNSPLLYQYSNTISLNAPKINLSCPIVRLWRKDSIKFSPTYIICNSYNSLRTLLKKGKKSLKYFDN